MHAKQPLNITSLSPQAGATLLLGGADQPGQGFLCAFTRENGCSLQPCNLTGWSSGGGESDRADQMRVTNDCSLQSDNLVTHTADCKDARLQIYILS